MHKFSRLLQHSRAFALALLASTFAIAAFAQADPPARIGRIAWLSGDVFLNNQETGELSAAPLNQPLTSGDVITTQSGARAEIQIGAMTLRLDADTRVEFNRIDDQQVRLLLNGGRVIAKLPTDDSWQHFLLETNQGRFMPRSAGIFHVDRDSSGAVATAYFGTLRFEYRDTAFDIGAGESARTWVDNAGQFRYQMAQGVRDDFTQWSAARDQGQRSTQTARYVSPEMTGAQDLDAYGDWTEQPEYGGVWFPRVVPDDWAPYRAGRWTWVAPWGWSWVGYEPWGFAPFHYGRWAVIDNRWGWIPGNRVVRPVYAPALVAWGSASAVAITSRRHAPPADWFPLAPREVYAPFYRSSSSYVRHVNAPHVGQIRNVDEIVARPREFVRQNPFSFRNDPRALSSTTSASAFSQRRFEAREMGRSSGEARSFPMPSRQPGPHEIIREQGRAVSPQAINPQADPRSNRGFSEQRLPEQVSPRRGWSEQEATSRGFRPPDATVNQRQEGSMRRPEAFGGGERTSRPPVPRFDSPQQIPQQAAPPARDAATQERLHSFPRRQQPMEGMQGGATRNEAPAQFERREAPRVRSMQQPPAEMPGNRESGRSAREFRSPEPNGPGPGSSSSGSAGPRPGPGGPSGPPPGGPGTPVPRF